MKTILSIILMSSMVFVSCAKEVKLIQTEISKEKKIITNGYCGEDYTPIIIERVQLSGDVHPATVILKNINQRGGTNICLSILGNFYISIDKPIFTRADSYTNIIDSLSISS